MVGPHPSWQRRGQGKPLKPRPNPSSHQPGAPISDPAFDKPGLRPGMRQRQGCAHRPRAAVQLPGWRLGPPAGHCPHSGRLANFTKDSTTSWVQQPRDGTRGCRVGSPPWPCHPAEGDEPREQTAPWRPHGHMATEHTQCPLPRQLRKQGQHPLS